MTILQTKEGCGEFCLGGFFIISFFLFEWGVFFFGGGFQTMGDLPLQLILLLKGTL